MKAILINDDKSLSLSNVPDPIISGKETGGGRILGLFYADPLTAMWNKQ